MHKFSTRHSTHSAAEVAVEEVRCAIVRIEVQAPRVERTALVERSRPEVAPGACVDEATIAAIAGSWQEDAITIGTSYFVTFSAFYGSPGPGALASELVQFFIGRHAPLCTHIDISGIVLKVEYGLVVYGAVRTFGTVLGH